MTYILLPSFDTALQVMQQAVVVLTTWAGADPLMTASSSNTSNANLKLTNEIVAKAQEMQGWTNDKRLGCLELVFDQIKLNQSQNPVHYRPASALEAEAGAMRTPAIPYARGDRPSDDDLEKLKRAIQTEINHLNPQNLSQLTLFVEKFGSHLSFGEPDIALIDLARSTAALAAALAQQPSDDQVVLVAGDLMGVQKFIYTISSDGALKSLRARSFYLEIATEEIVYRLLRSLNLPRTNIIYAGASKFYILAPALSETHQLVQDLQKQFNDWLLGEFQKKVFLAMAVGEPFPAKDLAITTAFESDTPLSQHWRSLNDQLSDQATRKFDHALAKILEPQASHEPCKVCHRDDDTDRAPVNSLDPTSPDACPVCRQMFALGGKLLRAESLLRTTQSQSAVNIPEYQRNFEFRINGVFYQVITDVAPTSLRPDDSLFLINNWDVQQYAGDRTFPLLLGNYGQHSQQEYGFMSASEMTEAAQGIKRVGYLRLDVDQLAQIFGRGLGQAHTLPRLTGLSRQMTYFFKVYLNSLARERQTNLLHTHSVLMLDNQQPHPRPNLLFIYAGGDDLFVSGAWNEVVEFAFDVYQSFRAYTGNHPDITLSGGISLSDAKYPLYQAAEDAGQAEKQAKKNGRDSLGMFGEVFHWSEWLGSAEISVLDTADQEYLRPEVEPELFGILPFVERLDRQLEVSQSRSFVRNLLATAQVQTQMLKEIEDQRSREAKDIRYFLHLPKIAYTIARLPSRVRDDPDFDPVRVSLKSPYNAPYFKAIATWLELLKRKQND